MAGEVRSGFKVNCTYTVDDMKAITDGLAGILEESTCNQFLSEYGEDDLGDLLGELTEIAYDGIEEFEMTFYVCDDKVVGVEENTVYSEGSRELVTKVDFYSGESNTIMITQNRVVDGTALTEEIRSTVETENGYRHVLERNTDGAYVRKLVYDAVLDDAGKLDVSLENNRAGYVLDGNYAAGSGGFTLDDCELRSEFDNGDSTFALCSFGLDVKPVSGLPAPEETKCIFDCDETELTEMINGIVSLSGLSGGSEDEAETDDLPPYLYVDEVPEDAYELGTPTVTIRSRDDGLKYMLSVAVPVTNKSDQVLYLDYSAMDLEDADGKPVDVIDFIDAVPCYLEPGETGWYYREKFPDYCNEDLQLKGEFHPVILEALTECPRYEVSDVSISEDEYGALQMTGRVENTTKEKLDYVDVFALLFDKDNNLIYSEEDMVELLPGEKKKFSINLYNPYGITSDVIDHYEVYAYYDDGNW